MIEIKHRYTGDVLYRAEHATTMREAVEFAAKARANLADANLADANLADANLARADLGTQWIIQGQVRSDGHAFFLQRLTGDKEPMIKAGCRHFTIPEAQVHWETSREGQPLLGETRAIVRAMVDTMHIRGLK